MSVFRFAAALCAAAMLALTAGADAPGDPFKRGDVLSLEELAAKARKSADSQVLSEIALDTSIVPRAHSALPGYGSQVEQCGEFVYRYFRTLGRRYPKNYPTLGQPAEYILGGDYKENFPAFRNPSAVPPRAGDILAAMGRGDGEFHTALIWKVTRDGVWVYQANVPYGNASPDWRAHVMKFELRDDRGKFWMPPLRTSRLGYRHDMPVVGWIHPIGTGRLPGAPQ